MTTPTFPKGIRKIYRVIDGRGRESIYIPQTSTAVTIPWNHEAIDRLTEHFTNETEFFAKDASRGRTYACKKEWWLDMDADTLIQSAKLGRDIRNAASQL